MQCIQRYHFVELLHQYLCTFIELCSIRRRPPVTQVAFLVRLPAFIVKAMRDLVAYGRCSGIAVYKGVIKLGVFVSRYGHLCCRKYDLVVRRIVVSIVGLPTFLCIDISLCMAFCLVLSLIQSSFSMRALYALRTFSTICS